MTWMLLMVVPLWSEMVYMGLVLDMVGETHSSLVFLNMENITNNVTVAHIKTNILLEGLCYLNDYIQPIYSK